MIMNAFFAFFIVYAILRYQLLHISVVIRKGLLYSILTVTITAVDPLCLSGDKSVSRCHRLPDFPPVVFLAPHRGCDATAGDWMQAGLNKRFFR